MLSEYLSDPLPNPVLRIKASHLRPLVPRLFPPEKPLGDAVSFCVDAHTLPHVCPDDALRIVMRGVDKEDKMAA
jgi:hypothetical protein